jgi:hypothetical protein
MVERYYWRMAMVVRGYYTCGDACDMSGSEESGDTGRCEHVV